MASVRIDEAVPFVCAEEKDERAAAVGACGGEDADHEDDDAADMAPPPYQEGDDIDSGLCCYLCDDVEAKKWYKWRALFEHVRRMHGATHKMLNGTYLHKMARAQLGEQSRIKYKARATAKAGPSSCGAAPRSTYWHELAHPRPMLPRMLLGAGALSGMLSIWDDELNQQARKACRVIDTCEDVDGEWAAIMADILSAPNPSHVAQVIEGAQHASARSSNEQA
jgi:hypothetical protein